MSIRNNSPNHGASSTSDNLSQDATDQLIVDPQQMTNPYLNYVIDCPIYRVVGNWVYAFVPILLWPPILFHWKMQPLISYNEYFSTGSHQDRPYPSLPEPYHSGWMRDAQAEGRTSEPTGSDIQFSFSIQMVPSMPLSIENTEEHAVEMLTDLRNANASNEAHLQMLMDEIGTLNRLMTDLNHFLCTLVEVESGEDIYSSDNSEEGSTYGSENVNDSEDEYGSDHEIKEPGRTSPIPSIQNRAESNQINLVTRPTTSLNVSQDEAQDIDLNVHYPTDPTHQLLTPVPRLTCVLKTKAHNRPQLPDGTSNEHIA